MRSKAWIAALASLVAAIAVSWLPTAGQQNPRETQDSITIVAIASSVSEHSASLEFSLSNGETTTIHLGEGSVLLNGSRVATSVPGGAFESAWREVLEQARDLEPSELVQSIRDWNADGIDDVDSEVLSALLSVIGSISTAESGAMRTPAGRPTPTIDLSGLEALESLGQLESLGEVETAEILEVLRSLDISSIQKDIRERVAQAHDAGAASVRSNINENDNSSSSFVGDIGGNIAALLAMFVAMCCLGLGLVFFAPRQLEVVADTVHNSFWRSFFAGLFAQPLIVPIFGMLLLGLTLTVIGILVIPFVTIAFVVALALAILGGYLAVARAIGEAYLRRRMSQGIAVGGALPYRYMAYGLIGLIAMWVPAVLLGWIPVAGKIFSVGAIIFTWMIATAGFGATILSRAGLRSTFSYRFDSALSDEYLYRTPRATPIVDRRAISDRTNE